MTTVVKKELTVGRYEFFKEKGLSDVSIAKQYGMDQNQLNKWKKEHDLIGKDYGLRGKKSSPIKTVSIQEEEVVPLREKNLPVTRLVQSAEETERAIKEYNANKKVQEKLKEKQAVEITPTKFLEQAIEAGNTVKEIGAAVSKAFDSEKPSSIEETQIQLAQTPVPNTVQSELDQLRQEKAELEKQLKHFTDLERYQELMLKVSDAVKEERHRQNKLYGHQRHESGKWLAILAEEVGEVAQAMQRGEGWGKESDADDPFKELTHVSAVANAWAEQVLEEAESDGR